MKGFKLKGKKAYDLFNISVSCCELKASAEHLFYVLLRETHAEIK